MSLISYSQNHEDVLLWRALKHVEFGFYVDVGANDPIEDSVTKLFYDNGWHGINIEPSEEYSKQLDVDRPRDINIQCLVSDTDSSEVFYETTTRGWSTSSQEVGKHYESMGVATAKHVSSRKLDSILKEHLPKEIHFLKIDVEGAEKSVILGMDFSRFRPWVLVIEALDPLTKQQNFQEWEMLVLDAKYQFVFFDGVNRYYLADEHIKLKGYFNAPANVLDGYIPYGIVYWHTRYLEAEARITELESQLPRIIELEAQLTRIKSSVLWKLLSPFLRLSRFIKTK